MPVGANEAEAFPVRTSDRQRSTSVAASSSEPAWRAALRALAANVWQPEKRLMLAVLEDALATLLRDPAAGEHDRRLVAATERWVAADDADWPFSFVSVCDALDLDASRLRRWVNDLREAQLEAARQERRLRLIASSVRANRARWTFRANAFQLPRARHLNPVRRDHYQHQEGDS